MFNFNDTFGNQSSIEDNYVGYAGEAGNVILIIISIIGIIINLIFSVDYSKNIITIKNRNNAGISTVEKILCFIAIIETFISIFWMVNNLKGKSKNDERCKIIAHFEIFFNLLDWLVLSTSLYQIRIIILNTQEILVAGRRVWKFIILCLIISIASMGFSIPAKIGGLSPMLTCFISIDNITEGYQIALFWIFLIIPLFCFLFGGYQVFLIMRSQQYKNDKTIRNMFIEYSYFVITYIISSIFLILTYIIYYIIIHTDKTKTEGDIYKIFIAIVTLLTCATPLAVGIIRYWRTGLLKRLFKCCKKRRNNLINDNGEELVDLIDESKDNDNKMYNYEKKMIENLIVKYYTAVSFALGKSKYDDEEGTNKEELLKDEPRNYRIDNDEILKDLDLSLNDDIKVLQETNIDIEVTEYNVNIFKKLRRLENLDEDKIIEMLQPKYGTNDLIRQKKDTLYISSTNKLLVLKKIKREKMINFQKNILPNLYDYFSNNPNSIICRVFGLYRIKIEQAEEIYMALTYNIYESLGSDNVNIKKMELSEMDLKQHMRTMSSTFEYAGNNKLLDNSLNDKHELSIDDKLIEKKNTFKVFVENKVNELLENIIDKENEFLKKFEINGCTYTICEIINNINADLINTTDDIGQKESNKNKYNALILNNFKKYEFKSSRPNSIYYIFINEI